IDNNSLASAQALGSGSLFANSDDWSVQGDNVSTLSLEKTSSQHYTWNVRFTGNGKVTMQNANNTLMTDGSGSSVVYADWWKTDAEDKDYEKSPVHSYYETKYPELFSAGTQPAAGLQTSKVIKSDWLTSAINKESIEVKIADHAPVDSVRIHLIDHLLYLDTLSKNGDYESIVVSKGEIGTFLKKYGDSGVHVVVAEGVESEGTNEDLDYWIYRSDGRVEEYNAEDVIHRNAKVLHLGNTTQPEEDLSVSMTQYLPDRKLTFDSVEDGSELYLLKGGKYTCEEGLSLTPATKGAVKVNNKNLKLTVKKDSLITLTKGDETKTVILHAVKLKKKTITLNSRKTSCSLSEIFTQAGEMLPDVENGKFLVSVLKDKNGILSDVNIPAADGTYVTLDDFTAGTTGKKGSALIQATFGGKVYKATVKCTGYPLLPESTVSGNLVQNLLESDAAGNRVVSFDSVENGDTLLLYKNGKYALESGVTIEPIGDEYSKAVKVKENKKTGIRPLTIKKEAPVRLTKGDDEKIILINRVAVKKKSVTLKPGMSCSLSDLIWNAYELLPDTQSEDPSDFAITVTDKKGAVFIQDGYFPAAGTSDSGSTTLDDFMIQHGGRKGSATVQVYFGGKAVKVKVNCK
ncbi:MAG: hypothetical protein K6E33_01590, partial [Lachnospiraceae bacterium]|nr:hypothetical protein [Lachnospiraceae bacterium]